MCQLITAVTQAKHLGGGPGYFLGGYVPPGTPNWHPVLKKISSKIYPVLEMGQFFIPHSSIRPKTDTPF